MGYWQSIISFNKYSVGREFHDRSTNAEPTWICLPHNYRKTFFCKWKTKKKNDWTIHYIQQMKHNRISLCHIWQIHKCSKYSILVYDTREINSRWTASLQLSAADKLVNQLSAEITRHCHFYTKQYCAAICFMKWNDVL